MNIPDKNVEAVRQKMLDRSAVGYGKYGTTTERTDIDLSGWLNHLQQELMDAAIYCQAAMSNHSDIDTLEQEIKQVRARLERVESEHADMLSALTECDEAMEYMSEYDIPLCLPERVKSAIAKAQS